jgi:hypothetical protein
MQVSKCMESQRKYAGGSAVGGGRGKGQMIHEVQEIHCVLHLLLAFFGFQSYIGIFNRPYKFKIKILKLKITPCHSGK